jgi:hypothetical protein
LIPLLIALLQLLALRCAWCRATVLMHVAMLVLVLLHLARCGACSRSCTHAATHPAHAATAHACGENGTRGTHGHCSSQKTKDIALFHDELLEVEKRESASTTPTALSARMGSGSCPCARSGASSGWSGR